MLDIKVVEGGPDNLIPEHTPDIKLRYISRTQSHLHYSAPTPSPGYPFRFNEKLNFISQCLVVGVEAGIISGYATQTPQYAKPQLDVDQRQPTSSTIQICYHA
jgi:hypothetical protein